MKFIKRSDGSGDAEPKTNNKETRAQKFWREWKEAHDTLFFDAVASAEHENDLTIEDYTDTLREEAWKVSESWGKESFRNGQGAGFAKANAGSKHRR